MANENMTRADLWDIAVALYKTSLASMEDAKKWDRHAAAFASHSLDGDTFVIGVADQYAADFYSSLYAEPLRISLVKAGAPENITVKFMVTEAAKKAEEEKREKEAAETEKQK